MKNKYFPDEELTYNDLFFMCFMIEMTARKLKQHNKYIVNSLTDEDLYHLLSCANVLHCQNPLQTQADWIKDYNLEAGTFDITDVDKELCRHLPSETAIGAVYARLIDSVTKDYVKGIKNIYNSEICNPIDNYNASAYYEPSYVITRAYYEGGF